MSMSFIVACENGNRPRGVITYPATDAVALSAAVEHVLQRRAEVAEAIDAFDVPDTVGDEVELLVR